MEVNGYQQLFCYQDFSSQKKETQTGFEQQRIFILGN